MLMTDTVSTDAQSVAAPEGLIAPHDRRVRVFVSSTLVELAAEREAARAAITSLRLTPVMFELGARPHPPRELYRSYLAQSDVFVGVYGERYGWVAPGSEVSGLEDEYLLSGDLPRLLYVKTPAPAREPRLTAMIERIWADSGASTTPYRDPADLARLLADDLAVLLTERFDASRPRPAAAAADLEPAPPPVPPTAMLGRERELEEVLELLRRPGVRLVTLLGPGGIGKTRLALEAAARLAAPVTAFADLAPLSGPELVPAAVAAALGVRAEGTRPVLDVLADRIGRRSVLLVLDNFEHVVEAAPVVARLLAACPDLRLLVTSRSVLHVLGEHEVPLPPLDPGPAAEVFVERARQVRPDLELDEDTLQAVRQVVARLDGIPLAIELAAARVRLLPPEALARRLDRRLDLSSQDVDRPARQQTLRTTVGWSYALLGRAERSLLRRLSVFAGGFSLEAAEAVAGGDPVDDVLETLSALVGHSLVSPDAGSRGEPRFRMLETVREFAAERLDQAGEREPTMRILTEYLRGLAQRAEAGIIRGDARRWLARIDADLATLRAGVDWALEQDDAVLAVRLTAPLTRYWWVRGLLGQMLDVAERVAALPSAASLPAREAALLLWTRGTIRIALGRAAEAVPLLEEVVATRAAGDQLLLGPALFSLALVTPVEEGAGNVRDLLTQAVDLARANGDRWGVALALIPLGDLALLEGDVAAARPMHEEVLALAEATEDDHMRAQAHDQLGLDALLAGELDAAGEQLRRAAALHGELRDHEGIAYCLEGFAALALAVGRAEEAARLMGTAAEARRLVGVAVWPFMQPLHERLETFARTALPDGFDPAFSAGLTLEPLVVLADAAAEPSPELSPELSPEPPGEQAAP
jgi:predicted ATPase